MSQCQVKKCPNMAEAKHVYDCGEEEDHTVEICDNCYNEFEVMQDGEKYYYFKVLERAEKMELLN